MRRISTLLEIIGGARPIPDWAMQWRLTGPVLGLWWALLIGAAYAFAGASTKFIYIDF